MPRRFQTLEDWVDQALSDQDKTDHTGQVKSCSAIGCLYVKPNGVGTEEVHLVALQGKTHTAASLARTFQYKIEGFAQNLGRGSQSFRMIAFYGGEKQYQASHPVRTIDGDLILGEDVGGAPEGPTDKGVIAQLMRHVEHKDEMIMEFWRGTVANAVKDRHELQAEVNESYKIVREMMMSMEATRHTQSMEREQYHRSTQERKALIGMIPALANGLTGKEIFPKESADSALLDAMARRMSPDMVDAAVSMGFIPKEAHGAVVARIVEVRQRDEAEQRELARIPPASRDGANDVQGN